MQFELMTLLKRNGRLEQNNITVCQYNVEFHWPSPKEARRFAEYLLDTVRDARYLPLKPIKFWKIARLYALNVDDKICAERYLLKA
ncbi:unnamed protein product [Gongylonema pulchrum]|uniref:FERM domain-containing protein n=1 Tax=Gongylonema pulchrum TaxID=637853 RepID=A0A183DTQ5_9BILA|nr:unnamed protein product [Gongylonema pulchrum]